MENESTYVGFGTYLPRKFWGKKKKTLVFKSGQVRKSIFEIIRFVLTFPYLIIH